MRASCGARLCGSVGMRCSSTVPAASSRSCSSAVALVGLAGKQARHFGHQPFHHADDPPLASCWVTVSGRRRAGLSHLHLHDRHLDRGTQAPLASLARSHETVRQTPSNTGAPDRPCRPRTGAQRHWAPGPPAAMGQPIRPRSPWGAGQANRRRACGPRRAGEFGGHQLDPRVGGDISADAARERSRPRPEGASGPATGSAQPRPTAPTRLAAQAAAAMPRRS
jgi:hypothetical protein